eukprot:TRINITY_DN1685_c0_g1_i8.p1 TRINITY_DN1685_c0_g1~~TRINITY_DN1685_c0_g1_i8.p1  ORF type:complete len:1271 (-),score=314.17 TRINITY_DN1685_c0_g1_i8:830-4642(-)
MSASPSLDVMHTHTFPSYPPSSRSNLPPRPPTTETNPSELHDSRKYETPSSSHHIGIIQPSPILPHATNGASSNAGSHFATNGNSSNAPSSPSAISDEDMSKLFIYFSKYPDSSMSLASRRSEDEELLAIQQRVNYLFIKDYDITCIKNRSGELCATYPLDLIIIEGAKGETASPSSSPLPASSSSSRAGARASAAQTNNHNTQSSTSPTSHSSPALIVSPRVHDETPPHPLGSSPPFPSAYRDHSSSRSATTKSLDTTAHLQSSSSSPPLSSVVGSTSRSSDAILVHTPPHLPKVNEARRLETLFKNGRFARVRARFPIGVILWRGKNICRSSTLSQKLEYMMQSVHNQMKRQLQWAEDVPEQEGIAPDGGDEDPQQDKSQMETLRNKDISILEELGVRYICDLMVENKKRKFGFYICSSEKIDMHDRYSPFTIASMPYPGVEFFQEFHHRKHCAVDLYFDWSRTEDPTSLHVSGLPKVNEEDGQQKEDEEAAAADPYSTHPRHPSPSTTIPAVLRAAAESEPDGTTSSRHTRRRASYNGTSAHLAVSMDEYKSWDLIVLTQNYLKLIFQFLHDMEPESGLLVHCISGWDRTPLFVALLRLSLWADGEIHQELSAREMVYMTVAYDWLLFSHQFSDRSSRGEDIFYFCFYFLEFITGEEFSINSASASSLSRDHIATAPLRRSRAEVAAQRERDREAARERERSQDGGGRIERAPCSPKPAPTSLLSSLTLSLSNTSSHLSHVSLPTPPTILSPLRSSTSSLLTQALATINTGMSIGKSYWDAPSSSTARSAPASPATHASSLDPNGLGIPSLSLRGPPQAGAASVPASPMRGPSSSSSSSNNANHPPAAPPSSFNSASSSYSVSSSYSKSAAIPMAAPSSASSRHGGKHRGSDPCCDSADCHCGSWQMISGSHMGHRGSVEKERGGVDEGGGGADAQVHKHVRRALNYPETVISSYNGERGSYMSQTPAGMAAAAAAAVAKPNGAKRQSLDTSSSSSSPTSIASSLSSFSLSFNTDLGRPGTSWDDSVFPHDFEDMPSATAGGRAISHDEDPDEMTTGSSGYEDDEDRLGISFNEMECTPPKLQQHQHQHQHQQQQKHTGATYNNHHHHQAVRTTAIMGVPGVPLDSFAIATSYPPSSAMPAALEILPQIITRPRKPSQTNILIQDSNEPSTRMQPPPPPTTTTPSSSSSSFSRTTRHLQTPPPSGPSNHPHEKTKSKISTPPSSSDPSLSSRARRLLEVREIGLKFYNMHCVTTTGRKSLWKYIPFV